LLGQNHLQVVLVVLQAGLLVVLEHLRVVLHVVLWLGQKHRDVYVQKDKGGIRASLSAIQFRQDGVPFGTTVGDQRSKFNAVEVAPLGPN
jgi:hypothetical protein